MKESTIQMVKLALETDDTVIKFKDSIKKVVGLVRPTAKGMDI